MLMIGVNGKVERFLSSHPVFTRREFRETVSPSQPVSSSDSLLKYHVSTGRVRHVAPSVYAAVPPHLNGATFQPDRILVASRIREDGVLAFHTALELHGLAYSESAETQLLSNGRPGEIRTVVGPIRFVVQPAVLRRSATENVGVNVIDRRGLDVRTTSVERTLVDCAERPDLVGGEEELANAMQIVQTVDVRKFVELVVARRNQTLAGFMGCWLESRREDLMVDDRALEDLKQQAPSAPRSVLGATTKTGQVFQRWNVILPNEFLHPSFEGGPPGAMP